MARSVDLTPVSPKGKLLKDINEKLKSPKYQTIIPDMTQSETIPLRDLLESP